MPYPFSHTVYHIAIVSDNLGQNQSTAICICNANLVDRSLKQNRQNTQNTATKIS